jgi:hypothetical protein
MSEKDKTKVLHISSNAGKVIDVRVMVWPGAVFRNSSFWNIKKRN